MIKTTVSITALSLDCHNYQNGSLATHHAAIDGVHGSTHCGKDKSVKIVTLHPKSQNTSS